MQQVWLYGWGCELDEARSLELARESSERGSRYGQLALGLLYQHGGGGVTQDDAQALALYRLAAAQNLDEAQCSLGRMYYNGFGVAQDDAEALRLMQLAAAQGNPLALFNVAILHEYGRGVRKNKAAAIRWYRRAQAAVTLTLQPLCRGCARDSYSFTCTHAYTHIHTRARIKVCTAPPLPPAHTKLLLDKFNGAHTRMHPSQIIRTEKWFQKRQLSFF